MSGTTAGIEFTSEGDDVHMTVFQGKTISFEIIWGGATPLDVTQYAASLQIRDLKGQLMLEFSTVNGMIAPGGVDGKFTFSGTAADSRSVARVGLWELELNTPGGEVYRALSGNVTPIPEVVV